MKTNPQSNNSLSRFHLLNLESLTNEQLALTSMIFPVVNIFYINSLLKTGRSMARVRNTFQKLDATKKLAYRFC